MFTTIGDINLVWFTLATAEGFNNISLAVPYRNYLHKKNICKFSRINIK
jgi:hypothetical protein